MEQNNYGKPMEACSSTHRVSPCSPAFRHKLAIAIAADSKSAAPPREMTGSPNSASRGEQTVASADALHNNQSTGAAAMSGGSEYLPRSPRGRSNERLRCVPEIDETLERAGSFDKRSSNPKPNPIVRPDTRPNPNLNPNPSPRNNLALTLTLASHNPNSLDRASRAGSFYKRRTSDHFRATRASRIVAPLAQLQAPGAHVILAAEANFKMHSGATEELGEAVGASVMPGSLGAHTGSFSKRSTSDSSVLAKRGARGALCRASHAVRGADEAFTGLEDGV